MKTRSIRNNPYIKPSSLVSFLLVITILTQSLAPVRAASISQLREQSQALQQQIDSANAQAGELSEHADSLKQAIGAIDTQIVQVRRRIKLLNNQIAILDEKLVRAQKELDRQKELLRASMRALYVRGDASSVELLIASDNFSQFMDEQEYLDRLKASIYESANRIVELKNQIQKQRNQQESMRQEQLAAKRSLDDTRRARARLLAATQGQEARFESMSVALAAKQRQVEEEMRKQILAGSFVSMGRVHAGEMIARVGMTGMTYNPHLHFELHNSNFYPIDPLWGAGTSLGYGLAWPVPSVGASPPGSRHDYGCQFAIHYSRPCANGGTLHAGIDIGASIGTPIVAAKSGDIIFRGNQGDGYGIKVIIAHYDGTYTLYAHTSP